MGTTRSNRGRSWSRSEYLTIAGLALAVISVLLAIAVPEVRCAVHLDECRTGQSSAFVDAPRDPNLPFDVPTPAPYRLEGKEPRLFFGPQTILNRGKPVVLLVRGSGFSPYSEANISLYFPNGGTSVAANIEVSDGGYFKTHLLWRPVREYGTEWNNGNWMLSVHDAITGASFVGHISVRSDERTPSADQWSPVPQLKPYKEPDVSASTAGRLCTAPGARSTLHVSGFTPNALVEINYLRPDGKRVTDSSFWTDAIGEEEIQDFWQTKNCRRRTEFTYRVVLIEPKTGRRAEAMILLRTK